MAANSYWLVKSEPNAFSIQDLAKSARQTTCWDGVRNYQARNFMRDAMRPGDEVLFYHSNADPPAIVGTATVASKAYADHTAWDPSDPHYDEKASPDNPIWQMVDIRLQEIFDKPLSLEQLRAMPGLEKMELLRKGSRLSVQPVRKNEYDLIIQLARSGPARPTRKKPTTGRTG
jgi:predicted RNA-binding protein with PUA-like domain